LISKSILSVENRVFSYSLSETSTISTTGIGRTLTSATSYGLPHRFATWFIAFAIYLNANGLLGRELFVFIRCGQSKASDR
jgi:hypothetical protein